MSADTEHNSLVWLRQDLRLSDNPALYEATKSSQQLFVLYILDDSVYPLGGAQRWWLHYSLEALQNDLKKNGIALILKKGPAQTILLDFIKTHAITHVYWNRCYEPDAMARDTLLKKTLTAQSVMVQSFNASLLNEPHTVLNKQGTYFKVFTYYWKHCIAAQIVKPLLPIPDFSPITLHQKKHSTTDSLTLSDLDLLPKQPNWAKQFGTHWEPGEKSALKKLSFFIEKNLLAYAQKRDYPATPSTSLLSPHLHFGEISPWQLYHRIKEIEALEPKTYASSERFLAELGWREFSYYLLYHFKDLPHQNFNAKFNGFKWAPNPRFLKAWQKGQTGYPIVDAGMRELWQTGYMHNRVRMIVASFLTKHLLQDWRLGAAFFWDTLVDADLANNSASWQWVAGTGADAAPYFRIFNPILQSEKFDKAGDYIRRWVPELSKLKNPYIHQPWDAPNEILNAADVRLGQTYPYPLVEHQAARKKALELYKAL